MGVEDLAQALVFLHSGHSYPQNHLPTRVQILALHKSSVAVRAGNANAGRWGRGGGSWEGEQRQEISWKLAWPLG